MLRNRGGGLESAFTTGLNAVSNKLGVNTVAQHVSRFKGKLGGAIAVITSMIVGFLVIPNNVMYFIDDTHKTRLNYQTSPTPATDTEDVRSAYIHAGIAVILLGCLSMVVSIVLSYFAAKSKYKTDAVIDSTGTRTVLTCLIMMNIELFMAIIAGCMELLYRPLTTQLHRQHTVECAIAVFNIIIYVLYVITMILTSNILQNKSRVVGSTNYHHGLQTQELPADISLSSPRGSVAMEYYPQSAHSMNAYDTRPDVYRL